MQNGAAPAKPGGLVSPNKLRASTRAQRNDVGPGGQSGGHLDGGAGGNGHVVIFTGPKTTEHRGRLLRFDPGQGSQEGEDAGGWPHTRRVTRDVEIFLVERAAQTGF